MNFTKKDKLEIFENAVSWIVVMAMFIYGAAKLFQFDGGAEIDKTIPQMAGMELMWAFYGFSKTFAITLGGFEILGGILILLKPTRLMGCLFTSTLLVNIILQDIYFDVHLSALKAAIFYQVLIVVILWLNRRKVLQSLKLLLKPVKRNKLNAKFFFKLFIAFVLFAGLRIAEYYITIKW